MTSCATEPATPIASTRHWACSNSDSSTYLAFFHHVCCPGAGFAVYVLGFHNVWCIGKLNFGIRSPARVGVGSPVASHCHHTHVSGFSRENLVLVRTLSSVRSRTWLADRRFVFGPTFAAHFPRKGTCNRPPPISSSVALSQSGSSAVWGCWGCWGCCICCPPPIWATNWGTPQISCGHDGCGACA